MLVMDLDMDVLESTQPWMETNRAMELQEEIDMASDYFDRVMDWKEVEKELTLIELEYEFNRDMDFEELEKELRVIELEYELSVKRWNPWGVDEALLDPAEFAEVIEYMDNLEESESGPNLWPVDDTDYDSEDERRDVQLQWLEEEFARELL